MTDSTPLTAVDPGVREITVSAPIATCFDVFVNRLNAWWPPEHHVGQRDVVEFRIEPHVGGRCYDVDTTGGASHWGTVLTIDPPARFCFAWHVQGDWTIDRDPALQSEDDVTFTVIDDATTAVRLEHRHLERHRLAPSVAQGVASPGGWMGGLERFGDVAGGRPPRPLPGD
jgi:uncharacterized protein YndB with AHSA1/START domain